MMQKLKTSIMLLKKNIPLNFLNKYFKNYVNKNIYKISQLALITLIEFGYDVIPKVLDCLPSIKITSLVFRLKFKIIYYLN